MSSIEHNAITGYLRTLELNRSIQRHVQLESRYRKAIDELNKNTGLHFEFKLVSEFRFEIVRKR